MATGATRLAIPIFRSRVAPVLNWCSKILIVGEGTTDGAGGQEVLLLNMNAFERLRILRDQGIRTLICGALSPDLLSYGEHLGLRIICGVAGDIEEVLLAYQEHQLDQPRFRLPGCTGRAKERRSGASTNGNGTHPVKRSNSDGRTPSSHPAGGNTPPGQEPDPHKGGADRQRSIPGSICTCPRCGMKIRHERGVPCAHIYCPRCDLPMARK